MIRLSVVLTLFSLSCSSSDQDKKAIAEVVTPGKFSQLVKEKDNLQLIDVRTLREFQAGHLINAQLIDYYKPDFKKKLSELDKNKPVAVYCAVGVRSNNTLKMLKSLGFKEAYDLKGGIQAWARAGLPLGR